MACSKALMAAAPVPARSMSRRLTPVVSEPDLPERGVRMRGMARPFLAAPDAERLPRHAMPLALCPAQAENDSEMPPKGKHLAKSLPALLALLRTVRPLSIASFTTAA
ncbi:MAG: hypothetical protein P8Y53_11965 [Pseudolabrys sp.]